MVSRFFWSFVICFESSEIKYTTSDLATGGIVRGVCFFKSAALAILINAATIVRCRGAMNIF